LDSKSKLTLKEIEIMAQTTIFQPNDQLSLTEAGGINANLGVCILIFEPDATGTIDVITRAGKPRSLSITKLMQSFTQITKVTALTGVTEGEVDVARL
jgi:hypothetical protein